MLARLRCLFGTLWVGSLWTIGYIVAPTLFLTLTDRVLAGTLAGHLFRIEAWLGLVIAAVLAIIVRAHGADVPETQRRSALRLIGGMVLCILLGYFATQPTMNALREAAGPAGVMASAEKTKFGILHGISSAFYLLQSLLGIGLILKLR